MEASIREAFNQSYSTQKYQAVLQHLNQEFPNQLAFRVSESPIFLDQSFKEKLLDTCESIVDQLMEMSDHELDSAIPAEFKVHPVQDRPTILCIDFAICEQEQQLLPALIELQACASLQYYQYELDRAYRACYEIPRDHTCFLSGLTPDAYLQRMQKLILSERSEENVVLVDFEPKKQKTKIDFAATQKHLGISSICLRDLKQEGNNVYYFPNGKKTRVDRIYNRFIFDEIEKAGALSYDIELAKPISADWIIHPNWFFKISKHTMPRLEHQYIPTTYYAHQFPAHEHIRDFVLKPLYSFSGQGVNLDPQPKDLAGLTDPRQYILQRKINFTPLFLDPEGERSKAEIRMIYTWLPEESRPRPTINLVRMTKSAMSNVDHNQGAKIWTGGSIAYFPS